MTVTQIVIGALVIAVLFTGLVLYAIDRINKGDR